MAGVLDSQRKGDEMKHDIRKTSSPWGAVQGSTELAPGIVSYHTAGHGGIWLSSERQQALNWSNNWLKSAEWWEEDCDWAIPYYFFRADIEKHGQAWKFEENLKGAVLTIKAYHPEFTKREGLTP